MTEQWQELKETIIEMRDNDGTGTQQEVCKFLANYMGVLEKQMVEQEPILDKIRAEIDRQEKWLLQAGYTAYNVDIAFDSIKSVLTESEE